MAVSHHDFYILKGLQYSTLMVTRHSRSIENVINRFCVYIYDYWKSIKHNYNLINFSYSTDLNQD